MVVLRARQLCKTFGGLQAIRDFNIDLKEKELVGLIGPNGAGKTTIFNLLTGVYDPTGGSIHLMDKDLVNLKPYQITSLGIARTFQNIRLFDELSVLDNIRVANHWYGSYPLTSAIFRLPSFFKGEEGMTDNALEILEILKLTHRKYEIAKNLPYGERRRLEIARALAAKPKVLLLDEPAAGMNPQETRDLMSLISSVREDFDLTILLIEHDMSLVMGVCERIIVLDHGKTIAGGSPEEIKKNPKVIGAYLGEEAI
ncbi:MAG: ABC transporter ATP-binding protein [Clostridia bacterium]|nr:ABC transporter ATP-binding protein [Clostridia bacterium]